MKLLTKMDRPPSAGQPYALSWLAQDMGGTFGLINSEFFLTNLWYLSIIELINLEPYLVKL